MKCNQPAFWYRHSLHPFAFFLWPFSKLFQLIVYIRQFFYRYQSFRSKNVLEHQINPVPVIVVGNITVGGTGKTPFVLWLTHFLKSHGFYPGIVSRGVGGKKHRQPHKVTAEDKAEVVGDEALLLLKHATCPIVIGIDRNKAAQCLLNLTSQTQPNIIISDDGLQHYRLKRDIEIVMVDGKRLWGNKQLLPAGPLREPLSRLDSVDVIIINGDKNISHDLSNNHFHDKSFSMSLIPADCISIQDTKITRSLSSFRDQPVHAVAAIGHPQQFFSMLQKAGLQIIPHIFPDHYLYQENDIHFADDYPILMTEKDAVKCQAFAKAHHWYVDVKLKVDKKIEELLLSKLGMKTRLQDVI